MANKEIREVELKFKSKGLDGVDGKINKTAVAVENLKTKSLVGASMATEKLSKGMTDLSGSAGLAGATVSSLGQGIGDIQYGFGAVANNINQVGSLFTMLVAKSGGVKEAMKDLGKQLVGPMGIMLAFQLGIAAINYFTSRTDEAEKSMNKLTESMASNTSEILLAKAVIEDANTSDRTRAGIIEDLNTKYKDLNIEVDKNGKLTQDSVTAIDNKVLALEKLARAEAARAKMTELVNQELEAEIEMSNKLKELGFQTREEFEAFKELRNSGGGPSAAEGGGKTQGRGQRILKEYDDLIEEVGEKKKTLIALIQADGTGEDIVEANRGGSKSGKRDKVKSVLDLDESGLSTDLVNSPLKTIERLVGDIKIAADMELDAISEAEAIKRAKRKEFADMELADKKLQNEQMLQALGMGLGQAARLMTDREGKATKASKAISSASVLIDTYQSASKVYKTYAANPIMAKIMAAATYAGGIARVKAINSVRVPHSGGGQGPSIQAPSFNVIGQGSVDANIVANAIEGQAQQPIQAYVVESQMTSTQEMARAVEDTASIS